MRLTYQTQASAQAVADRIYADMSAAGALEPGTTGWAVPYQDLTDAQQEAKAAWNPVVKEGEIAPIFQVSGPWYVTVNDRCRAYLTDAEVKAAGFPVEVAL